jgi:ATP-binding cassette subfamily C protein
MFLLKALFSVILIKKAAFFVATVEARSARTIAAISFGGDLDKARVRSREEMMFAIQAGSPAAFNGLLNALNAFLTEATLFIVICAGFLFVDPGATLAAVVYFGSISLVIQYFVGTKISRASKTAAEGSIRANTAISDLLAVFRELLVLDKRDKYIDGIYKARLSSADSAATQYYLSGMPRYIIEASLLVGVALFVLSQSLAGDIVKSAATVGVFLSGGFRLTAALLPLQNALITIKSVIPSANTAHEILRLRPVDSQGTLNQVPSTSPTLQPRIAKTSASPLGVRFDSVNFSYSDSEHSALTDVTFDIEAGTQVALMGPSGAGKSTLADLICRVLIPTEGSVLRTNLAGERISFEEFGSVSYVPQRPGLVSGTILENVALAEDIENIDRNRVMEAMRLANLGELISDLPQGLETRLGKLQEGLSGGQMQRLGLARALYANPGLLVMDEATSALDADSESEIQKALDAMRGKVTVVLIAHRLNIIQHADKVLLIEDGRLTDSGTFRELVNRNPSVERVVALMKVEED